MRNRWTMAGCVAVLLWLVPQGRPDEANPYQSLIDNSPFMTPAFKARLGQRDTVAMSFVGYTRVGTEWFFALLSRKSGKALWLKLNEEEEGIKIEQFDEAARKLHITVGGIGFELMLEKESK